MRSRVILSWDLLLCILILRGVSLPWSASLILLYSWSFGGRSVKHVIMAVLHGSGGLTSLGLDAQDLHDLLIAVFLVIGGSFCVEVMCCTRQVWKGEVG